MILGITGKIGSGKTEVAKIFQKNGFFYIDADQIVNQLYQPGQLGWRKIKTFFGTEYLNKNQQVNRPKLRRLIFQNLQKLTILNRLIHPLVFHEIKRQINQHPKQNIIIEAIDFSPRYLGSLINKLIVVTTPEAGLIQRIQKNRNLTPSEIKKILNTQSIPTQYDFLIVNNHSLADLKKKIKTLYSKLPLNNPL